MGTAEDLHRATSVDRRQVEVLVVDRPALVLGSTQADESVDHPAAAAAGIDVVRRRSGGGAVLVTPDDPLWVDIHLPASDHLWDDDVGRAAHWVGEAWSGALAALGSRAEVHRGPLVRTEWSDRVCFAGLGPGEVTVDGRKVVGLAQRRTRAGARFQCAALSRWDPGALVELLALSEADRRRAREELTPAASPAGVGTEDLLRSFIRSLPG